MQQKSIEWNRGGGGGDGWGWGGGTRVGAGGARGRASPAQELGFQGKERCCWKSELAVNPGVGRNGSPESFSSFGS